MNAHGRVGASSKGFPSALQAALYARVSTLDQNCEMQVRELREYAARRGWHVTGEYVDTGWSGAKASRPELDRLMKDARQTSLRLRPCLET
jgi:DNA invertase Pin-like site-specific DNA recombinase